MIINYINNFLSMSQLHRYIYNKINTTIFYIYFLRQLTSLKHIYTAVYNMYVFQINNINVVISK